MIETLRSSVREFMKLGIENPRCAEIGVSKGWHAETILHEIPGATIALVDPYEAYKDQTTEVGQAIQDRNFEEMQQNVMRFGDRARILKMRSAEAARWIPDQELDFVYIDGDHSDEGIRSDIENWMPKVRPGGMIAGHDYDFVGHVVDQMIGPVEHDDLWGRDQYGNPEKRVCVDWWRIVKWIC